MVTPVRLLTVRHRYYNSDFWRNKATALTQRAAGCARVHPRPPAEPSGDSRSAGRPIRRAHSRTRSAPRLTAGPRGDSRGGVGRFSETILGPEVPLGRRPRPSAQLSTRSPSTEALPADHSVLRGPRYRSIAPFSPAAPSLLAPTSRARTLRLSVGGTTSAFAVSVSAHIFICYSYVYDIFSDRWRWYVTCTSGRIKEDHT